MSGFQWTTQDYVYVTAECVTGVLSVLGNGLVLLAIWRTRALRTVTNCFIGSLAAADALVGIVVPPTVIFSYLGMPRNFYGCVFLNSLVVLITNISILNLLAVAVERFLAISDPFRYQRIMTVKKAMMVVVATWIIAILIGLIPTMGWNLGHDNFTDCSFTKVIGMNFMVYLIFFGVNLPPLFAMLIIYIYIFYIIRKQQRRTASQLNVLSREERRNIRQHRREIRGAKGLAYVIILFAVCWLPIHIMNSITLFDPKDSAPLQWLLVAIVLSHANSFVNPYLYAFSNSQFKRAMKRVLCCGRLQSNSSSDSSEGTTKYRQAAAAADTSSGRTIVYNISGQTASNGHTPGSMANESLSSEECEGRQSTLVNRGSGFINTAFMSDDTDTSDDYSSLQPVPSPQQKKNLRWHENVEAIPMDVTVTDMSNTPPQGPVSDSSCVPVDNEIAVPPTNDRTGMDSQHNSEVWMTPSSQSLQHTYQQVSSQTERQHSLSPQVSNIDQYHDSRGFITLLPSQDESNVTTEHNDASDKDFNTVISQQGSDEYVEDVEKPSVSDGKANGTSLSFTLTEHDSALCMEEEAGDWKGSDSGEELSVRCSTRNEDEEAPGSPEIVSIRL